MKSVKRFSLLLCSLLLLQGCATMSKNECLNADWLSIGFADGAEGHGRNRLGEHRQACAEYGIIPDPNTYHQGYDKGVLQFCTPRSGFAMGRNGYEYTGICPPDVEEGFMRGYDGGREIHRTTARMSRINSDLRDISTRLEKVEYDLRHYDRMLDDDSLSRDERRDLRRVVHDLRDERYDLRRHHDRLLDEKDRVDHRLDFLRRRYSEYER